MGNSCNKKYKCDPYITIVNVFLFQKFHMKFHFSYEIFFKFHFSYEKFFDMKLQTLVHNRSKYVYNDNNTFTD